MKAISVRQPWAWAIIHAGKDVENRTWATLHRGPLLIHAGKRRPTRPEMERCGRLGGAPPDIDALEYGAIVGSVILHDCVAASPSPWWEGPVGWLLSDPTPRRLMRAHGRLGLFDLDVVAP